MKKIFLCLWVYGCGALVVSIVTCILLYIFFQGCPAISLDFLLQYPKGLPLGSAGGIFPAIIGSLYTGAVAAGVASILSFFISIYLVFYCHCTLLYRIYSFIIQCISGIPSILLGLFGYSFFLMVWGIPRSVLSAGLTLALMILPFIILRFEKIFREFPQDVVKSSLSLGVSKVYTIWYLILPSRKREISSSIALATAYAMGAAAPVMYTGTVLYTGHLPGLMDPFMSLPFHLYILVSEGYAVEMAYGTAFVLLSIIFIIMIACHLLGKG